MEEEAKREKDDEEWSQREKERREGDEREREKNRRRRREKKKKKGRGDLKMGKGEGEGEGGQGNRSGDTGVGKKNKMITMNGSRTLEGQRRGKDGDEELETRDGDLGARTEGDVQADGTASEEVGVIIHDDD